MANYTKKRVGVVSVDAGMLMVCDPCYIKSQWEQKPTEGMRWFKHKSVRMRYICIPRDVKDMDTPFNKWGNHLSTKNNWGECVEKEVYVGKTVQELVEAKEFFEVDNPFKNEGGHSFGYDGACEATYDGHGGQMNFKQGHSGAGVAFRSGYGDGVYDVFAYVKDCGEWGDRVAKVEIVLIPDEDEDDE